MAKKATKKTQDTSFNLQSLNNKYVIGAGATAVLAAAPFVAGFATLTAGAAALATTISAAAVAITTEAAPRVKALFTEKEPANIAQRAHPRAAKNKGQAPATAKPVEGFVANVKAKINSAYETVKSYASSAYTTAKSYASSAYTTAKSYASSAYGTVKSYASSAYASLKSFFSKVVAKEQEVQHAVTSAVASGLKSGYDTSVSALNTGSKYVGSMFSNHKEDAAKKAAAVQAKVAARLKRDGIDVANIIPDVAPRSPRA
jgi:phage-related protein